MVRNNVSAWVSNNTDMRPAQIPINIILRLPLPEKPQRFCQMIVQRNGLVPKLPNEKILLLDLFLKRPQPLQLVLGGLEGLVGLRSSRVRRIDRPPQFLELRIRTLCEFPEFLFAG